MVRRRGLLWRVSRTVQLVLGTLADWGCVGIFGSLSRCRWTAWVDYCWGDERRARYEWTWRTTPELFRQMGLDSVTWDDRAELGKVTVASIRVNHPRSGVQPPTRPCASRQSLRTSGDTALSRCPRRPADQGRPYTRSRPARILRRSAFGHG